MFCSNRLCYGGRVLKIYPRTKDKPYTEVHETCPECNGEFFKPEPLPKVKKRRKRKQEPIVCPF